VVLLNEHFPTAHHLIVGDGIPEYVDFIKSEAMRMGLGDRVHFLGFQPDVPSLLLRIDVLVSTSHRESFGRTLIEAMAAGKPVVATRSGGPEEIVVEGECGYLVDVGNIEAIANRMARILGNPSLALALGNAGRQRAVERFDLAYTTQEIVRIVEEALSGQG
jgi:glycosyltransferase involved in cell wall biosynthesis